MTKWKYPTILCESTFIICFTAKLKRVRDRNYSSTEKTIDSHGISMTRYRVAAGIALLICGTFIGILIHSGINNSYASNEMKQLHSEVADLKKATMFTMLKDESSSDRIQAVSYADRS